MNKIFGLFAGFGLAVFLGCGQTIDSDFAIVGGKPASRMIAQHNAAIINPEGRFQCSSVLIAPQVLLTAAHCVPAQDNWYAYFDDRLDRDTWQTEAVRKSVKVIRFATEPLLLQSGVVKKDQLEKVASEYNDLALIILDKKAPDTHRPLALAYPTLPIPKQQKVILAGYGITGTVRPGIVIQRVDQYRDFNRYVHADHGVLRMTTAELTRYLPSGEWQVGPNDGQTACVGDSGGPLIAPLEANGKRALVLLGVASRANCQTTAWYTDVRLHYAQIKSLIATGR